jgi:hypothetical protein
MNPQDRARLVTLGYSAEVIAKTEEVLRVWEVSQLFTTCSMCHEPCFVPELSVRRTHRRKKLPADLLLKRHLLSIRDREGNPRCHPCDDWKFEYGY